MAKKTSKTNSSPKKSALPEGFRTVISVRADGYFRVEEGASIQGILLGRYPRRNDPGFYYQLRLTKPCETVQKKDGDGGYYETTADPGEVISVDERALMFGLIVASEEPDKSKAWEVFIIFNKKIKSGSRSYWEGECGIMPVSADVVPF